MPYFPTYFCPTCIFLKHSRISILLYSSIIPCVFPCTRIFLPIACPAIYTQRNTLRIQRGRRRKQRTIRHRGKIIYRCIILPFILIESDRPMYTRCIEGIAYVHSTRISGTRPPWRAYDNLTQVLPADRAARTVSARRHRQVIRTGRRTIHGRSAQKSYLCGESFIKPSPA